ncbi:MAG TPA: hypothetical protein PLS81_11215 [Deltaproteobacteria bacterium]|nr:hypothetical protein [Deltaproteobacteria bacterium]HOM30011.1 hypothetical protein [Deltaproteobacteria bacterium]HPP79502.1 hypothetical protein [Deltaproteobacteria bacterium]
MFYFELLDLIKNNANELTRRACKEISTREETRGYRKIPADVLYERVFDVYNNLSGWLGQDDHTMSQIRTVYTELGRKRYHEGIPLHEVVLAFMLVKRILWEFIQERQFFETTFEMGQALELNNRVVFFFDRVIYFVSMGYEDELLKNMKK